MTFEHSSPHRLIQHKRFANAHTNPSLSLRASSMLETLSDRYRACLPIKALNLDQSLYWI